MHIHLDADTYKAAVASARVTLSAARYLTTLGNPTKSSCPAVFALSRPPGHHAGSTISGGYCFFNNVAIAARCFQSLDKSRCPIAILDIDYHHGNGTQEMFYSDESVLYVSLHAENDFPYFTGSRAEEGAGAGVGFNVNMPLPQETGDEQYLDALSKATDRIKKFRPTFVIVSLGVDTHEHDPICKFNITTPCYRRIGESIRSIARPTLFVLEGGYHLDSIGDNVANVLQGFEVAKVS
ncbi:Arginase/deacetylase [Punctularia strigosozonata HHB-11173 SS5]|uniref:Arginase/deacetylase n=1 Tax=Punctularia strigosozonata (strain HHB-11173) TaxID=741275 RepID=UPI0004417890|nr:Arginase/deacetylase [Punctularia strigosozonata HHB-11173 SS5]EIN14286.1 Arginase/deacetylase [Punctularia strigosozonata HHB-11173 SS5]